MDYRNILNIKISEIEVVDDVQEMDRVKLLLGQAIAVLQLERMANHKFMECAQLIVMASGDKELMELWNKALEKIIEFRKEGMKAIREAAEETEKGMGMESVKVDWLN